MTGALDERPAGGTWPRAAARQFLRHPGRLSCALFVILLLAALPRPRSEADFRSSENRRPTPHPPLKQLVIDPAAYIHGVESYIADRVALRKQLIGAVGYVKWKLGVGANSEVIVGHDGWMFNFCTACLDDMRGTARPRADLVGSWVASLETLRRYAEGRGTRMTTVMLPRKEAVYRDMLPEWVKGPGRATQTAHFLNAARATPLDVIYPLEDLRARKSAGKLYYRYDHHFTTLGALQATDILLRHLHDRYGMGFKKQDYDAVPVTTSSGPLGDHLSLAVLQGVPWLSEADHRLVPRGRPKTTFTYLPGPVFGAVATTDDPSLPTLVMYGDSFLGNWAPLIAPYFRRAVFIMVWRGDGWPDHFPTRFIDEEKPDFLIYARWEHGLTDKAEDGPRTTDDR